MKHSFIGFCFFLIVTVFSCKKNTSVPIGQIIGASAVCVGEQGLIYTVNKDPQADKVIWTVPEGAEIKSGQGTESIKVDFGRKQGRICAIFYKDGEPVSTLACMDITFGIPDQWCRVTDFGGGKRDAAAAFSIGEKGYVFTGKDSNNVQKNDVWEFDPKTNVWSRKNDFHGLVRTQAVAFSIGDKGYLGTGNINPLGTLKDFWAYDPTSDSWQQKADLIGGSRQYAFSFSIGNKGYIGGGVGVSGSLSDFYEYNPETNEWIAKTALPVFRAGAASFSIGNKGYVGTGLDYSTSLFKNDFWVFDPSDVSNGLDANNNPMGKWTQKTSIPAPGRYVALGFSIGNKGYIGTGTDGEDNFDDFWEYDTTIDTGWVQKESITNTTAFAVGFSINNKIYIGTGAAGNFSQKKSDFWVYAQ